MTQPCSGHFDVVLIGSGLASTAAARALANAGARVAIVPGVARSRSPEADGGLVDAELVSDAFGAGAPLNQSVLDQQGFCVNDGSKPPVLGTETGMPERRAFRRVELESWALEQATNAGATLLEGFVEGSVLPAQEGLLALHAESGACQLSATNIVLCEGADPRIGMRAGLRPDYGPEDQIHFARTILEQASSSAAYRAGRWRTSWGMPVDVAILPLESGVMVSVAARIENVMRCSRSAVDALDDVLASKAAAEMGLTGTRLHSGVELVALRRPTDRVTLIHDRLLMGIDGSGVIDPRHPRRFDIAIQGGLELAAFYCNSSRDTLEWDEVAMPVVRKVRSTGHYHDDPKTGYLEEGATGAKLASALQRMRRGIVARFAHDA